jgi:hypothetical protein
MARAFMSTPSDGLVTGQPNNSIAALKASGGNLSRSALPGSVT